MSNGGHLRRSGLSLSLLALQGVALLAGLTLRAGSALIRPVARFLGACRRLVDRRADKD